MLETKDAVYHEPYVSVRLPFRVAEEMGTRTGPKGTYQAFDPSRNLNGANSRPYDFIFYSGEVELKSFSSLPDLFDGHYPSDHLPVVAKVIL